MLFFLVSNLFVWIECGSNDGCATITNFKRKYLCEKNKQKYVAMIVFGIDGMRLSSSKFTHKYVSDCRLEFSAGQTVAHKMYNNQSVCWRFFKLNKRNFPENQTCFPHMSLNLEMNGMSWMPNCIYQIPTPESFQSVKSCLVNYSGRFVLLCKELCKYFWFIVIGHLFKHLGLRFVME